MLKNSLDKSRQHNNKNRNYVVTALSYSFAINARKIKMLPNLQKKVCRTMSTRKFTTSQHKALCPPDKNKNVCRIKNTK